MNKRLEYIALFLGCMAWSTLAQAQTTAQLTGTVIDMNKKSMEGAVAYWLNTKDSSLVKSTFSDANGNFEFTDLRVGNFLLTVSQIGYQRYWSTPITLEANSKMQLPPIVLQEEGKSLSTVTIAAKLPLIERKIDRTVMNVDALISAAGSSAWETLEKVPGVVTEEGGGIRLKGKNGVVVFIDDKPTYLAGEQLEAYLKSLPASSLKQIEVMTNPPAKYDAAGNAGIINIKTKRNKLQGIYGNVAVGYTQGRYARSNNSLNLNYGNRKINAFANYNFGIQNSFQDLTINRYYKNTDGSPKSTFTQNSYIRRQGMSNSLKIGLDYSVNDKTTIGFVATGLLNPNTHTVANLASVLDANDALTNTVLADNRNDKGFNNGSANVNMRHQFDSTGRSITIDADYVAYQSSDNQIYKNTFLNPTGVKVYEDRLDGAQPSAIAIYAFKSDYTQPLKGNASLDAGIKTSYTKTDNEAIYATTIGGITSPNYDLSNRFTYNELIAAAYLNVSKSIKQWDFQAGLRTETTTMNGNQYGNPTIPASDFSRSYTSLFPTAFVSYKLDSTGQKVLQFSYGRRIERPYFQDLNPFISPLDKFTFYTGNPFLQPTYSHNFSLAYTHNNVTISTGFSRTDDGIFETLEIKNDIYYSRPNNIGISESLTLGLETSIPFAKWLTTTISAEGGYNSYRSSLYTQILNSNGYYGAFSINNSMPLGKGWTAELSGDYQTDFVYAQLVLAARGGFNAGVQKKVLNGNGTIRLSATDILYSKRFNGIINNLAYTQANWFSNIDTRAVTLSFSYKFGKTINSPKRHEGNGSESERNRVKS